MKIRKIKNIFYLLLAASSMLSCSKFILSNEASKGNPDSNIIIVGTVTSLDGMTPLEGIKIHFEARSSESKEHISKNVYTDSRGIYSIKTNHLHNVNRCTIVAEDPADRYANSHTDIRLTWDGPSYNAENNTLYINDCNLYMSRK